MTTDIDVLTEDPLWPDDLAPLLEKAAQAALDQGGDGATRPPLELCIALSADAEVQDLNRDYRGKDKPTNVLSFPMQDFDEPGHWPPPEGGPILSLGDVILARETLLREAGEQGKPFAHHVQHMVVHGVLHLLGYDHEQDTDAARMEALEIAILASLDVPDPYAVQDE